MGHWRQDKEALFGWYFVKAQSTHTWLLWCKYLPAGQAAQSDMSVAPVALVVLPDGHWRQESEPAESWYLLMGQSVHRPELSPSKYLPVGQRKQSDMFFAPGMLVVLPEGHWRQESEPAESWYLERGQSMHPTVAQSLKPMPVLL